MKNYNNLGYGSFLQDGGQMQQDPNGAQMIEGAQEQGQDQAPEGSGQDQSQDGGQDPKVLAQQFLQAFQQLPPQAQQMVMQALSQGAQGGQGQ